MPGSMARGRGSTIARAARVIICLAGERREGLFDWGDGVTVSLNLADDFQIDLSASRWRTSGVRGYIAGMSGCGKTNLLALICEELHRIGPPFLVVDPDGDYVSLAELGQRVQVIGGDQLDYPQANWVRMALAGLSEGRSVVVDLSKLEALSDQRVAYTWLVKDLLRLQRGIRRPMFLMVEEAHLFAPQKRSQDMDSLNVTVEIGRRGRRCGINSFFCSQRPRDLEADLASQCNLHFCGRIEFSLDWEAVRHLVELPQAHSNGRRKGPPPPPRGMRTTRVFDSPSFYDLTRLGAGEFYVRIGGELHQIQARRRATEHVGATPVIEYRQGKLWDVERGT